MPFVGSQSKLRPKMGLPVLLRSFSTMIVEQPRPLVRSAIVLAKSRSDSSRPEDFAAASISRA